jgi:hypothetical protein
MMDALEGIMDTMKTELVPFSGKGAGIVVGLTAGSYVHGMVAELIAPIDPKNEADQAKRDANATSALRMYVAPLAPIAIGIAAHHFTSSRGGYASAAGESIGLGMAAYGVGKLVSNVLGAPKDPTTTTGQIQAAIIKPFAGLGEQRYLLADNQLGVEQYLHNAGLAAAPITVTQVAGLASAPITVTQVAQKKVQMTMRRNSAVAY